ncbi:MAG: DUF465 domain-containing protein [Candidatus Dadabacteria bacterium]|nr:MAG: DUF465 domain-containing protein [Candidatus Dadabacteria bacterium]
MEKRDHELIQKLAENNHELRKLYQEHLKIEAKLAKLAAKPFLTAQDEQEEKALKRKKLRGVDLMMKILNEMQKAA